MLSFPACHVQITRSSQSVASDPVAASNKSAPAQANKSAQAGAADSVAVANGGLAAGKVEVRKRVKRKC